jgi:hypothetical protein
MSPRNLHPSPIIYLPIFDARSALSIINVLDAIITAIWAAHGDMIVEMQTDLTRCPATPLTQAHHDDEIF